MKIENVENMDDGIVSLDSDYVNTALLEYINDDETFYAIMLTGQWGAGKTFFIRDLIKRLEEETIVSSKTTGAAILSDMGLKKYRVMYISLHSLKNMNEFYRSLALNLFPPLVKKAHDTKVFSIAKSILSCISFAGLNIGEFSLDYEHLSDLHNIIIFIDDLERTDIGVKELMGVVSNLIEEGACKVVLICNEDELKNKYESEKKLKELSCIAPMVNLKHDEIGELLSKNEKDKKNKLPKALDQFRKELFSDKTEYLKIKEKTIGRTLCFKHNEEQRVNIISGLITKLNKDIQLFDSNRRTQIINIYKKSKSNNLRVLRIGLNTYKNMLKNYVRKKEFIEENFPKAEHQSELKNFKDCLLEVCLIYAFTSMCTDVLHKDVYDGYLKDKALGGLLSANKLEKAYRDYTGKKSSYYISELFKVVGSYTDKSIMDVHELYKYIYNVYVKNRNNCLTSLDNMRQANNQRDEDVIIAFKELEKDFFDKKYDLYIIPDVIKELLFYNKYVGEDYEIRDIINWVRKVIDKYDEDIQDNINDTSKNYYLKRSAFHSTNEDLKEELSIIEDYLRSKIIVIESNNDISKLTNLFENEDPITELYYAEYNSINFDNEIGEKIIQSLDNASGRDIKSLNSMIQGRYINEDSIRNDINFLDKLYTKLNVLCEERNGLLSGRQFCYGREKLKELLDWYRRSDKNNAN